MVEHPDSRSDSRPGSAALDATLAALAHPLRRALLESLAGGEACVTQLAAPLPLTLAAVSKHLRVLEAAGLVRRRRRGREHWLSLDPEPLQEAAAWLARHARDWSLRLDRLEALLRQERQAQLNPPEVQHE